MTEPAEKGTGLIKWGTSISIAGGLAVILSGYGYQWGWWHFSTGFSIIPWGTGAAIVGGILAGIGLFRMKNKTQNMAVSGMAGMFLAVLAIINIGYWYSEVQQGYPPIHDISTDTENPPEFVAIAPLRKDAPNPVEYAGEETAEAQKEFYTNLEPLQVALNYDEAYDRALEAAREMPWKLVGENREQGRIEAFEKLAWFGFIDDVVIRVDTAASGSTIDVRSKSRIGRGDLGVNAKRIKAYFEEYQN
ncbi:MAG: hypothetical protein CL670_00955 [Balneola sp.]|jgi:uncharacterized protein (DUF1499 family)|nr:hypothetical protein [Balneola sp.]MBE77702.1 hypothetical protein [Balneola sp.]|tara:strand:+ start:163 stop:903 length:741 start_codon:yes stop_codon:yes gene_type:complete